MHSPYEAVYGFDRTHILRMTFQEYMSEKDVPSSASSSRQGDAGRLLSSRDPDVKFCTKYPVYDRAGRELCVLYQILEAEVQREIRRVEEGGDTVRKSGVRLSAEITLDDTSEESSKLPQRPAGGSAYHRPTPFVHTAFAGHKENDDEEGNAETDLVEVSASSHQFSSAMLSPSKDTGSDTRDARGSSFSIYRDSGLGACTKLLGAQGVHLHHQQQQQRQPDIASDNCLSAFLPQRCNTVSPHCFANGAGGGEVEVGVVGGEQEEADNSQSMRRTLDTTARGDPLRFTTVRDSELRTTKQLFAPGRAMTVLRRTIKHSNPISCQAYGAQSKVILASLVAPLITTNLEAVSSGGEFWNIDGATPQLQLGTVVTLGEERRYRILRYFASSDVYEAREEEGEEGGTESCASTQILVYRWSVRAVQQGANEAHRAALGLSLAAPCVRVAGYRYCDGGLTLIMMPRGYDAVPLSTIPLSPQSFPTCVKLLLRMLSDLVVKRTVHGNLRALNQIFLAFRGDNGALDMPPALLVPVHWERLLDFSMFVDRNVGRTIPIEDDDIGGRRGEHINHGQDVSMVIRMLLENELVEHLQPEQLAEAQRLMMMAAEPTQVANYLIQLKNTMAVIPSDMASLQQDYEVALRCQY